MASLERSLRRNLERTVRHARREAEAGARKALAQLGVGDAEAPKHLSSDGRTLRNRLRAHGRQLGDRRDPKSGAQATARLVQETAYEHWHRMLFARFLAEADLLIEPESGVAITLEEAQELAREQATDWLDLASHYAERMLPQIFRNDDPVLQVALPPETRSEMEDLLKGLPKGVFEADDSLGWVYQFWQAEKKEEVNRSETKIGADELPAVTQLFTEDYMVLFLLHNTLGAWWAGKVLSQDPTLASSAANEEELRAACRVGDVEWTHLRFVRDEGGDGTEGGWRPAAGRFEGWPRAAKQLKMLDPCMGSGHFLVFALPILAAFRMQEEGLSEAAAIDAVLRDNLFGLEIDPRCTQIAAFNLAFAAWRRSGFHPLPNLNLACSGLAIGVTKPEWLKLAEQAAAAADRAARRESEDAGEDVPAEALEERVRNGLALMHDLFAKAPWLGSLIDPRRAGADIFSVGFESLEPLIGSILPALASDDAVETAVAAKGMARAAQILADEFDLVITNVPYLGRGRQDEVLQAYCERFHKNAKSDLAACFVQRAAAACRPTGGHVAVVSPQSWFLQTRYREFRRDLLSSDHLKCHAQLGPGAFEAISGERVNVCLSIFGVRRVGDEAHTSGFNVEGEASIQDKVEGLRSNPAQIIDQKVFLRSEEHRISLDASDADELLADHTYSWQGIKTSDDERFTRKFWEIDKIDNGWWPYQRAPERPGAFEGRSEVIYWQDGNGSLTEVCQKGASFRGCSAWGKFGVAVSMMGNLPATLYTGEKFSADVSIVEPKNQDDLFAVWELCRSPDYPKEVRKIDKALRVTNKAMIQIPVDLSLWRSAKTSGNGDGSAFDAPRSPRQWIFSGNPAHAECALQVAACRLAGVRWPRQTGLDFPWFPALEPDGLERHADNDGVVCLTAVKGEAPAEQRLNSLLADVYADEWSAARLASLLADVDFSGRSLDEWLRDGFFQQHCVLFNYRPFVWHVWDGLRDGFHALVNYHRLTAPNGEGRRTLEKLIYSYLGDWIDRQRSGQKAGVEGSDARLAHAEHLRGELIKILQGEPPFDIFVRWKPLHEQPIGWDPDLNDGVRMNIRPFMTARPLGAKAKGASILRTTPKIKWDKDRGKEPAREKEDFPWFWGWDEATSDFAGGDRFDGNRWNDLHYSRAARQAARDRHRAKTARAA
ncbi:MAG TPA: N-6 DNA methylase [Allosphingosinicella sp.]|nr:N-6 DNA methylase [Allosphingosinicella sp.]